MNYDTPASNFVLTVIIKFPLFDILRLFTSYFYRLVSLKLCVLLISSKALLSVDMYLCLIATFLTDQYLAVVIMFTQR